MTFYPNDLYLSSGIGDIQNSWTASVSKHDTSTFYNWEQDNEPLYDLDERTSYLWEKAGYPIANGFSGIPGKIFVVSGDAPFSGESSSVGGVPVFKHLSSCIASLPNPLTYPAIVEVMSFGSLGDLKLHGIKIDANCAGAGLEIINRNFGRSVVLGNTTYTNTSSITSPDIVGTLHQACSIGLSSVLASGFYDTRWNNTNTVWATKMVAGSATHCITDTVLLSKDSINFDYDSATNKFAISEYGITQDNSVSADIAVTRPVDSAAMRRPALTAGDGLHALVYGNYLSKVSIKNCAGPIYVRGFCVDGASGTGGTLSHNTSAGFEVHNSNIMLENCLAIRCSDFGFKIINSDVELSRSAAAGRIYTFGATPAIRAPIRGVGIHATGSVLRVRDDSYAPGSQCVIQAAKCTKGFELINSRLMGGTKYDGASPTSRTFIQAFQNVEEGIDLDNSYLDHIGHLEVFNNNNGVQATNSKLEIPTMVIECNQEVGMNLKSSNVKYNYLTTLYNDFTTYGSYESISFSANGQHLVCDDSSFSPIYTTSMPSKYGKAFFIDSFGLSQESTAGQLPSIEVKNGSMLELVHPVCQTLQGDSGAFTNQTPTNGIVVQVRDNSIFKSKGSVNGPAIFVGPLDWADQQHQSIIGAENNSNIEICGPTLIGQGAIDILADNQSTVKICPHNMHGSIDWSGWDLDNPLNHTRVELHSTRACLVANNNSNLTLEDLGDYNSFWTSSLFNSFEYDYNDNDAFGTQFYTSGGFCQFYPNGQDELTVVALQNENLRQAANPIFPKVFSYAGGYFLSDYTSTGVKAQVSSVSTGGICVKAGNNSFVKVLNVHFPTGWYNTSGYWYDIATVNCDQLRIWNIGEGSHLDAAYCSVSGHYPSLAGYYGPSGVYSSGAGAIAYGVPNLPDTGTLSVLDQYGKTPTFSGTNYGPFRLYFSPTTKAKMMVDATSQAYGPPYQMWAQGYNTSGNVSGNATFSGIYSGINASQFIHVSSMIDSSYKDRIRLDESAADTFANARHCASTKSGRNALVTIYRATVDAGGIGYDTNVAGMGKGFKSADIFDLKRDN